LYVSLPLSFFLFLFYVLTSFLLHTGHASVAPNARAAHSTREGLVKHLHGPGPSCQHGCHVCRVSRSAGTCFFFFLSSTFIYGKKKIFFFPHRVSRTLPNVCTPSPRSLRRVSHRQVTESRARMCLTHSPSPSRARLMLS